MRRSRFALAMTTAAAALVALSSAPAHADPTWYNGSVPAGCESGALCVYRHINFDQGGWGVANFHHTNARWVDTRNAYMANNDSSWFNNGTPDVPSSVVVFGYQAFEDRHFCLDRGWGNSWDPDANDDGEANWWVDGC
ncbi:peptidase inhibitor family I36 protein [Streptomyces sp. NPDC060006]|uniref:peptidase inhibitor family I36 protein n=1 Tax=unclassified Streptomyces TaxID=2593676 RepID=UPI00363BA68E